MINDLGAVGTPVNGDQLSERIRAVPGQRIIVLPNTYTKDDAGRAAASIIELSAVNQDDILLLIPPSGNAHGALALADVVRLPITAPVIGVLFGSARTSSPVLLQACNVRVLSEHAHIAPEILDLEHTASCYILDGPETQTANQLLALERDLAAVTQQCDMVLELLAGRTGTDRSTLIDQLAARPSHAAAEAVAGGWADVILPVPAVSDSHQLRLGAGWADLLAEFAAQRAVFVPSPLRDADVGALVVRLLELNSERDKPVVLVVSGRMREMSAALWLSSFLSILSVPVIGVAASDLDLMGTVLLQACDVRLAPRDVKIDLGMSTVWSEAVVTLVPGMTSEAARTAFMLDATRAKARIESLVKVLARRTESSTEDWMTRIKRGDDLGPEQAFKLGVFDALMD